MKEICLMPSPNEMRKWLSFNVERVIIKEKSVEMVNCGAEDFLGQFDKIIFTTKEGKQVAFKKERVLAEK